MTSDEARHPADWPDPNARPCEDCGHVWFAGERRHEYLDHNTEHADDATVLCVLCRQQRGLRRAETSGPEHWA